MAHSQKFMERLAWIATQEWMFEDEKQALRALAAAEEHGVDYEGFKKQIEGRRDARTTAR